MWPSAYASGALVKCRKVGAKNWGNKSKNEEIELEEIYLAEEKMELTPENLEKILRDEGGASGMDPFTKAIDALKKKSKKNLIRYENVGLHEDGDYILEDGKKLKSSKKRPVILKRKKRQRLMRNAKSERKPEQNPPKNPTLRDWFKRKGAKGSKGGWVDCNAPDGKGGYKSCGRGSGEKRKNTPPAAPHLRLVKNEEEGSHGERKDLNEESQEEMKSFSERWLEKKHKRQSSVRQSQKDLAFHIDNDMPIRDNVYRHGTSRYFSLVNEARELWKEGKLNLDEEDIEIMESDLGQFGLFAGQQVPLDFPMMIDESLDEAKKKKKKKKDPPIGKPTKNTGGGKKYKVFVRNPKTGKIKKITYGDSKGGLKGNWNSAEARKSFASRHNCKDKKDRTKAGYWACRAHKDFGTNVPGRFW